MVVHTPRKADLSRAEDRRLAELAAAGEESAFEAIFERHHRGLLSLCRHLLGSLEEAEDALQHTFAAAYRQLVEREAPRHLRAWLYATARNRCLDVLGMRRELPSPLPPASTAGLSEEVERRSDLRELVDDIGRLPEDQRAALVLSEIEELRHAEVAQVLGCPPEKVRALVYQARSSLSGWREARALPCRDVRQELAVARGGGLRRAHLRRHLKLCRECAAFREDVGRQRRRVALVLPVLPALGLKESVLKAAWGAAGAGGGGAVAGGGGGLAALLGPTAIKIGAALLVLGGGAATVGGLTGDGPAERAQSGAPTWERSASSERRDAEVRRDREAKRASKRQLDRSPERTATISPEATQPDQPEQEAPAGPQAPEVAPPSAEPAPPVAQPAPAPPQDRGALPDVDVGVEVEVDPPVSVP